MLKLTLDDIDFTKIKGEKRVNKFKNVLSKKQLDLTIVLENIFDAHNISASLRSAEAVGLWQIEVVSDGRTQIPEIGKYAAGRTNKWMNIRQHDTILDCYQTLRNEGKKIYTTKIIEGVNDQFTDLYDLDLTQNIALVFGNEHDGISDLAYQNGDINFNIPIVGFLESLNISVAVAVTLFEAYRQRKLINAYDKIQLDEKTLNETLNNWLKR